MANPLVVKLAEKTVEKIATNVTSGTIAKHWTRSRENAMPVQIPQQPANTRISCKFSDSTTSARTVRVKFYGHVYDTSLT